MDKATPLISQRCTHLPPATRGLGPVLCPSCGWVEDGLRLTSQQVIARHPELRAQVEANDAHRVQQATQRNAAERTASLLSNPQGRKGVAIIIAIILVVGGGLLYGAIGTSGGQTYTMVSLSTNCDRPNVAFGEPVDDIVQVTNTSGHGWAATYAFVDRQGDFRLDNISMSNAPFTDLGGNLYNLGLLSAGEVGDIHIHMTASKSQTTPRVTVQVWGSSKSVTSSGSTPAIPERAETVTCNHTIQ